MLDPRISEEEMMVLRERQRQRRYDNRGHSPGINLDSPSTGRSRHTPTNIPPQARKEPRPSRSVAPSPSPNVRPSDIFGNLLDRGRRQAWERAEQNRLNEAERQYSLRKQALGILEQRNLSEAEREYYLRELNRAPEGYKDGGRGSAKAGNPKGKKNRR